MSTTPTPPPRAGRLAVARRIVVDLSTLAGVGLIAYGSWLIYRPAALIVGGLVLLAAGLSGWRR